MPPVWFAILFTLALSLFAGVSLYLLVQPSQYIRRSNNPWMEDTPWMRLQMRAVGLVVALFVLMVLSGIAGGSTKSRILESFHENVLMALSMVFSAFWITGAVSWILWRFIRFRTFIRSHFDSEKLQSVAWERRMTILFCSLFTSIVAIAYLVAVGGHHS